MDNANTYSPESILAIKDIHGVTVKTATRWAANHERAVAIVSKRFGMTASALTDLLVAEREMDSLDISDATSAYHGTLARVFGEMF